MMSSNKPRINEAGDERLAGYCATVAALVIALDESGVLAKNSYRDALDRLWFAMEDEEAVGEAGAVIERMLDSLDTHVSGNCPSADTEEKQDIWTQAGDAPKTMLLRG